MKPSNIKDTVQRLLEEYPILKDNDARLVVNVWNCQLLKMGINLDTANAKSILYIVAENKLTSADSITRCRRKLQEINHSLRGTKWTERHELQAETIHDLQTNF